MKVYGYSERGAVNALAYEIAGSPEPEGLLEQLLSLAIFPKPFRPTFSITQATLLIEQSFSDFGDADLVVLARNAQASFGAFLECKVKTYGRRCWRLTEEFERFVKGTEIGLDSSNLFTQLYHKQRMVQCIAIGVQGLVAGVPFPCCSSKVGRKIGQNGVVLRAVQIVAEYVQAPTSLLGSRTGLGEFDRAVLRRGIPTFRQRRPGRLGRPELGFRAVVSRQGLLLRLAPGTHCRGSGVRPGQIY